MHRDFVEDEGGATAVEYAVLLSLSSIVVIMGMQVVGLSLRDLLFGIADEVEQ